MAKKTAKSAKKASRAARRSPTPKSGSKLPAVRVRMYRQGLGDCFLITFDVGGDEKHILIDCGTLGTNTTNVTMPQVVQHIAATSDAAKKKGKLEVLVATHAHKDHVSGFLSQSAVLKGFSIKNVWMGWTEDPTDALAKKLGNKAKALRAAIMGAYALPHATAGLREKLEGIIEFEGGEVRNGQLAMGDTIAQALDIVRKFSGAKTTYHSPGAPAIEVPGITGFRFYVLGPPRDVDKLASMGDHGSDELYGLAGAIHAHASNAGILEDCEAPFDAGFCYPITQADQFFTHYASQDQKYRRIDGQWMQAASELAAKLDNFRNNTSLALAIERVGDGRVLLFPADAQQGNWLSWHDPGMEWKVKNAGATHTVDAADLLSRTVFYKVGHHCSHNATAKGKGLEIMRKNKELTAFIPVDRQVALKKSPPGSWRMPAAPLYRQLLEACEGRVVRADLGWAADAKSAKLPAVEKELVGLATSLEWAHWKSTQSATKNIDIQQLYIDYILE